MISDTHVQTHTQTCNHLRNLKNIKTMTMKQRRGYRASELSTLASAKLDNDVI